MSSTTPVAPASASPAMQRQQWVVMGVSGCGKSTVGRLLAQRLGIEFLEGDSLHSTRNIARMADGIALTDADRQEWLCALGAQLAQARAAGRGLVVSCSALKRAYRDILRSGAPGVQIVHLHGPFKLLSQRMAAREGHYMPPSLLQSQFAILEPPTADEGGWECDVALAPEQIVNQILRCSAQTIGEISS